MGYVIWIIKWSNSGNSTALCANLKKKGKKMECKLCHQEFDQDLMYECVDCGQWHCEKCSAIHECIEKKIIKQPGMWSGVYTISTYDQCKPIFTVETEKALYQANTLHEAMMLWKESGDSSETISVNKLG
jgi:hypothetical protein